MIIEHIKSITQGKWNWDRIANAYTLFRIRKETGLGHIGQFQSWIIQAATFVPTLLLLHVPLFACIIFAVCFVIFYMILCYVIGFYDTKKWMLTQRNARISSTELNPIVDKMYHDIEEIKVMLKSQKNKK